MQDQYGLHVGVEPNGISTRYEDTLRILVFQAVREALFNVVKHAGTLHATVRFEEAHNQVRLTIGDDGKGFDTSASAFDQNGSGGLSNFRHRLSLMGCSLHIHSEPGTGTRVMIDIPSPGKG
jgi:signal transduction histidine kinase